MSKFNRRKILKILLEKGHTVCGVFTQPDRPKGRGNKLTPPPVKEVALENNINVYQPEKMRDGTALEIIKKLNPQLIVVVAYGRILPKEILDYPKYGCINVHGSLLPKYRGAAPIQWSVLNGDEFGGVTTMFMAEGLDTGDMLLSKSVKIQENETASELYERLSFVGADLLIETIDNLSNITPVKQDESLATHAPMLSKDMCLLDFTKSAFEVHKKICGLSEWPCAVTEYDGKRLKVYQSEIVKDKIGKCGEIINDKDFIVACKDCAVKFVTVQYEGSKRMSGSDFLRGRRK
ncbi:MAG: methionyl-tRNA formyltransferase [Oscillospiraceae bacterium]